MIFPRDENGKTLDLNQREWKSEPRPGEPIFGPGLPKVIPYLIWLVIVVCVTHYFRYY